MVETTIKNINISKHDTKLISVVRLVIVIKCAPGDLTSASILAAITRPHIYGTVKYSIHAVYFFRIVNCANSCDVLLIYKFNIIGRLTR